MWQAQQACKSLSLSLFLAREHIELFHSNTAIAYTACLLNLIYHQEFDVQFTWQSKTRPEFSFNFTPLNAFRILILIRMLDEIRAIFYSLPSPHPQPMNDHFVRGKRRAVL